MTGENYGIVVTAGHVDHGKTTLIQALTGRWLDRLPEEKDRGMTIELGFTDYCTPSGMRVGIVDVPGHEALVRTMIRGAASAAVVLFVVDVREGMACQSREHLQILQLLGAQYGLVALTKCDGVSEEQIRVRKTEVRRELAGTFLEKAPLIPVSAGTGRGIERLEKLLEEQINVRALVREGVRESEGNFSEFAYMSIDRVCHIDGVGQIAGGTLRGKKLTKGDRLWLYPGAVPCRAQSMHIHGEAVEHAEPGYRVALKLSRTLKKKLRVGELLATDGSLHPVSRCLVRIRVSGSDCMKNGERFHFHVRSEFATCRIRRITSAAGNASTGDKTLPEEEFEAKLYLDRELLLFPGDRFILRTYSPVRTVAGGTVVHPESAHKKQDQGSHNRRKKRVIREEEGGCCVCPRSGMTTAEGCLRHLQDMDIPSPFFIDAKELTVQLQKNMRHSEIKEIEDGLLHLYKSKQIDWIPEGYYIRIGDTEKILSVIRRRCLQKDHPGQTSVSILELKQWFQVSRKYARMIFSLTDRKGVTKKTGGESERILVR